LSAAPLARDRLLTPQVLAGLGSLELVARTAVDGSLPGLHRSHQLGFSQEFAEYRGYTPGDDPRFIDWNVFARNDKTVVKRFYGDTNTRLMVMLDCSASMSSGSGDAAALAKFTYGRFAAAALLHLARRQHDAAGLLLFADRIVDYLPPRPGSLHTTELYHHLEQATPGGTTHWQKVLEEAAGRIRPRTLVVLISDLYVPASQLAAGLKRLGGSGHDLLVIQLLAPADWQPDIGTGEPVRDLESAEVVTVDQQDLARNYPDRLRSHLQDIRRQVLGYGGHYLQMNTDQPLQQTLRHYLNFRARHP
jgi:uncharacterized protein (DUF58 family)